MFQIEVTEVRRRLGISDEFLEALTKRGIVKQPSMIEVDVDPLNGCDDPVYDASLWERVPSEFREWKLETLVHNRIELEHFKQFLNENYASNDLMCWMDIEAFRR